MRRLCGWCGRVLSEATCPEEVRVTHGVCADCCGTYFPTAREKLPLPPDPPKEGRDDGRSDVRDPSV